MKRLPHYAHLGPEAGPPRWTAGVQSHRSRGPATGPQGSTGDRDEPSGSSNRQRRIEGQIERQTEGQTDRETDRETDRQRDRQRDR